MNHCEKSTSDNATRMGRPRLSEAEKEVYHAQRLSLKHRLREQVGHGALRKASKELAVNYDYLRCILAGRGISRPLLQKLEFWLDYILK